MANIKDKITFDEFTAVVNKVVEDSFVDGTYSPTNYKLSFKTAILLAFAPDYDLSNCADNNELWDRVTSDEAEETLRKIYSVDIYEDVENAVKEAINFRSKLITSGTMSMSDIALTKLFEVLINKVESVDTNMLTKENMDVVVKAVNSIKDDKFSENLVDTLINKGLLEKPNRSTRRNNIKMTKKN